MSNYNNHDEQEPVPGLLLIKKKNDMNLPSPNEKSSEGMNFLGRLLKQNPNLKTPMSIQSQDNEKTFGFSKKKTGKQVSQSEQKQKNPKDKKVVIQKKDNQLNKMENQKSKENEKMKALIAQMLNSMSIKNSVTQQLYPVSNQVIQDLLLKIQDEIIDLTNEADRKLGNQSNLHAEKQLQVIRRQINHCNLIKQLYHEKMNYMKKKRTLEQQIISLRAQNRDLKLKISRGIQSIQNYKHNLPCDREKQLIQKLSICTQQLAQEKEMRQNLEKNIQSIIMNFKKLYDQADAARKIVIGKLKEIQEKERNLKKMALKKQATNSDAINSPKRVTSFDPAQERGNQDSYLDQSHEFNSNVNTRRNNEQQIPRLSSFRPKPLQIPTNFGQEKQKSRQKEKQKNRQKEKQKQKQKEKEKEKKKQQPEVMTLQQKIKKMRNNQIHFKKNLAI